MKITPSPFVQRVMVAMQEYFGSDQRRIDHACSVAAYAVDFLQYIDADQDITLAAAYLHDIGIHEAERRHGSCGGKYQELEGPPIARQILEQLEAPESLIDKVCAIVGHHHTPAAIDSPEFRIIWDADAMVNLVEILPGKSSEEIDRILQRSTVTEVGLRRARREFLPV